MSAVCTFLSWTRKSEKCRRYKRPSYREKLKSWMLKMGKFNFRQYHLYFQSGSKVERGRYNYSNGKKVLKQCRVKCKTRSPQSIHVHIKTANAL